MEAPERIEAELAARSFEEKSQAAKEGFARTPQLTGVAGRSCAPGERWSIGQHVFAPKYRRSFSAARRSLLKCLRRRNRPGI
jgi:hypothetical protein